MLCVNNRNKNLQTIRKDMKTILVAVLSVIIILIMSLTSDQEPYQKYEDLVVESESLTDSALLYLRELHIKNDSLLDKYFPKEESYTETYE